jgi:glycine C-acetyltransferase
MFEAIRSQFESQLRTIRDAGLYKSERILAGPQNARIDLPIEKAVLNLCSNNYLGLADDPEVVQAAHQALDRWGYGLSSVRFICGTQEIHKELERRMSEFLGMEDTILYGSCFDANCGLFETILDAEDAVVSDELNHASIVDGIRLSKAQRFRYGNGNPEDLEAKLREASGARRLLIATDGVFSMDGYIAKLREICDLADRYGALVMVDDSHAVGFMGENGRGTHEHHKVMGRVDILTGTFGKALGGASGGYVSARKEIVDLLRQRSRPYLFSNTMAPAIVGGSLQVLDLVTRRRELRERLFSNTRFFREKMAATGFQILPGEHPIVPVMLSDAGLAARMADRLLQKGVYVIGFSHPIVPKGKARIRVQLSAAHTREDLEFAIIQFAAVREEFKDRRVP